MKRSTRIVRWLAPIVLLAAASAAPAPGATLLLRYTFDEAGNDSAIPALDSGAAPAATGTFTGEAARVTISTPGNASLAALSTNKTIGSSHYVTAGDANKLDALAAFTLTTWLNPRANPAVNDRILSKLGTSPFPGFDWRVGNDGNSMIFGINSSSAGAAAGFNFDGAGILNTWVFLAVTYDSSTGAVTFYSGNESTLAASLGGGTIAGSPVPTANSADFRIGSTAATTADRTPPFWFDDVRVYSGLLTLDELRVAQLQGQGIVVPAPAALPAGLALIAMIGVRRRRK